MNLSQNYNRILFFILLTIGSVQVSGQTPPNEDIIRYISDYADIAINEMVRTGVPASIKIAQGILETQAGKSDLVLESNNHFGIKCKSNWNGPKVYHDDDARGECFRKYKDAFSSYKDHSDFLKSQPRYAPLFDLDPDDYSGWAWGLKKAGYATNPVYAETLIKFIEDYQLNTLNDYAGEKEQNKYDIADYIEELTKNGISLSSASSTIKSTIIPKKLFYPSGVFRVNGVKVVFVEEGTSLLSISKKYNIAFSKILLFNDLPKASKTLKSSDLVYLQPKKSAGNKSYHRVKRNETLRDISQHEGIRLASLLHYNKLKSNSKVSVGQKLALKPKKGKAANRHQPNQQNKKAKSLQKRKRKK